MTSLFTFLIYRKHKRLASETENELMGKISIASELDTVHNEIKNLYLSAMPPVVFKLYSSLLRDLPEEDKEDVICDGWCKVLVKRTQYQVGSKAFSWIFRIVENTGKNLLDFIKRRSETTQRSLDTSSFDCLDMPYYSDDQVKAFEIEDFINSILEGIEKTVYQLYIVEGLNQTDISKVIDKSLGSTNKIIKSMLQKIKCEIEKQKIVGLLPVTSNKGLLNGHR